LVNHSLRSLAMLLHQAIVINHATVSGRRLRLLRHLWVLTYFLPMRQSVDQALKQLFA